MTIPLPMLALALCFACCRKEPVEEEQRSEGMMMMADSGNGRILFSDHAQDLRTGEVCLRELDLWPANSDDTGNKGRATEDLVFGLTLEEEGQLLVVYAKVDQSTVAYPGGILLLEPKHPPEVVWRVDLLSYHKGHELAELCLDPEDDEPRCRLNKPHTAQWTPDRQHLVVTDTSNNRVVWLTAPEGEDAPSLVDFELDEFHPGVDEARWPNAGQLIERDDRLYLLTTFKGSLKLENRGRIKLWDVTNPGEIHLLWSYPEQGYLAAVHSGIVQQSPQGEFLLYAHAYGAGNDWLDGKFGSVGMASISVPDPPTYLVDLVLQNGVFGFVREVELISDGAELLVTDSGCENAQEECGRTGWVVEAPFEPPAAPDLGGAFDLDHQDQRFAYLTYDREAYSGGLKQPFEADFLPLSEVSQALLDGVGPCPEEE